MAEHFGITILKGGERDMNKKILLLPSMLFLLCIVISSIPSAMAWWDESHYSWDTCSSGKNTSKAFSWGEASAYVYAEITGYMRMRVSITSVGWSTCMAEAWAHYTMTIHGQGAYLRPIVCYRADGYILNMGTEYTVTLQVIDKKTGETVGTWEKWLPTLNIECWDYLYCGIFYAKGDRDYLYLVKVYIMVKGTATFWGTVQGTIDYKSLGNFIELDRLILRHVDVYRV